MTDATGHVLDSDGVTPIRFEQTSPTSWANAEEIALMSGSVLTIGDLAFVYPEPFEIGSITLHDGPDQP